MSVSGGPSNLTDTSVVKGFLPWIPEGLRTRYLGHNLSFDRLLCLAWTTPTDTSAASRYDPVTDMSVSPAALEVTDVSVSP